MVNSKKVGGGGEGVETFIKGVQRVGQIVERSVILNIFNLYNITL